MHKPKVGCQPIIFGGHEEYHLAGRLKAMRDAGYDGVEIGPQGDPEADAELRRLLDFTELEVLGSHTGYHVLPQIEPNLEFLNEFGAKLMMVSGTGDRSGGADSYAAAAQVLNQCGEEAAKAGVTLCYHNHSWEFHDVFGDTCGMDILLRDLDPAFVRLCVDVYWVHDGGRDPALFLTEWSERVATVHLKDRKNDTFAEVGEGVLDFPAIFKAIEPLELPWVVTEQDKTDKDPEVSIKMSRDYLRDAIGI
jgi:sugar phosphate isomerase/epimerase